MARRVFPDDGSRLAYTASGSVLRPVAAGAVVSVFTDSAATSVADCLHSGGAPVTTNDPLRVDAYSRLPLWQGPADGTDTLYVVVSGGPATAVYARADDRLDDHETRIVAVEPGGGSAALRVAQNLADLASAATARTNLGLGTAATTAASAYDPAGSAAAAQAASQPLDADLTTIAGLTPAGSAVIQELGGAWAARTPTQLAATLPADQVAGTASLRTLGTGAQQAAPGSTSVQSSRTITAGAGLTGGGDLSANRTLTAAFGAGASTVTADRVARASWAGTAAEFAGASATDAGASALYYVTDTGAVYRSDGSSWVLMISPTSGESLRANMSPATVGRYFAPLLVTQTRTLASSPNQMYLSPCFTDEAIQIDSLAVNVATGIATGVYRMGVYIAANQAAPFALTSGSALLQVDGGTVDASTSGDKTVTFTAISIPARTWFFVAGVAQVAAATMTVEGNTALRGWTPLGIVSGSSTINAQPSVALTVGSVSGALPASTGVLLTATVGSGVSYRRSA